LCSGFSIGADIKCAAYHNSWPGVFTRSIYQEYLPGVFTRSITARKSETAVVGDVYLAVTRMLARITVAVIADVVVGSVRWFVERMKTL
jgi:hypothetical protein